MSPRLLLRHSTRAVSIACLLVAAGCGGNTADRAPGAPALVAEPSTEQNSGRQPAPEMTLDQYVEAGVPEADRGWSGSDMGRAAEALLLLARGDAHRLPRYESPSSGALFARLMADENLDFFRNPSIPLDQRMPEGMAYMHSLNTIMKLYLEACNKGAVGSVELAELVGAQLGLLVVMVQMADEFVSMSDKNDPIYGIRIQGLGQFRGLLATAVAGTLQTLTERSTYDAAALKRLLRRMQETFPDILPQLPDASRKETLVRLRSFRNDPKMADLSPELGELVDRVEGLGDHSASP